MFGKFLNPRLTRAEVDALATKRVIHFGADGVIKRVSKAPAAAVLDPATQAEHATGRAGDHWDGTTLTRGRRRHPRSVDKGAFVRAVQQKGKWGRARAALAQQGQDAQDLFDALASLDRDDALVAAIASNAGLTEDEMDEIFVRAGRAG